MSGGVNQVGQQQTINTMILRPDSAPETAAATLEPRLPTGGIRA